MLSDIFFWGVRESRLSELRQICQIFFLGSQSWEGVKAVRAEGSQGYPRFWSELGGSQSCQSCERSAAGGATLAGATR